VKIKDIYGEARHVAQPICICMARPKGGVHVAQPICVQACEEADAALRKKLGRRLRKIDRKMDHGFQQALARLHAVCTELDGARRPIDWDG